MSSDRIATKRLAAVVLLVLVAGCTGEPDSDGAAEGSPARPGIGAADHGLAPAAVSCPAVPHRRQEYFPFRSQDADAPELEAEITVHRLSRRGYCVDGFDWTGSTAIRAYRVRVEPDRYNYGEDYRVTDPEGSDELLNFPFDFTTYGPCRPVVATLRLTAPRRHPAHLHRYRRGRTPLSLTSGEGGSGNQN